MDRSSFQRKKRYSSLAALCFVAALSSVLSLSTTKVYGEDPAAVESHGENAEPPPAENDTTKHSETSPKEHAKAKRATAGLLLCRITWVDEKLRALFVQSLDGDGPRRTIYLDPQTLVRKDREKAALNDLEAGQEVAIRYVDDGDIAYAEGVFLITEEVKLKDYEMPKKKKKAPAGTGGGGGGGAHGAPAAHH